MYVYTCDHALPTLPEVWMCEEMRSTVSMVCGNDLVTSEGRERIATSYPERQTSHRGPGRGENCSKFTISIFGVLGSSIGRLYIEHLFEIIIIEIDYKYT